MHTIAFRAKRVFHSFLRIARRPLLAWPGLTAARFDMLSAFLDGELERPRCIEVSQMALRRKLGVCASVVSRMVRALVQLGWLRRDRHWPDLRTWRLSLTTKGEEVIRAARRLLLRPVERLVYSAVCWRGSRAERIAAVLDLWHRLEGLRYNLGDRATLEYPWRGEIHDH